MYFHREGSTEISSAQMGCIHLQKFTTDFDMATIEIKTSPLPGDLYKKDPNCFSCPDGWRVPAETAMGVLEKPLAETAMMKNYTGHVGPNFVVGDYSMFPVGKPTTDRSDATGTRLSVAVPNPHTVPHYDPTPKVMTKEITKEMINDCGVENIMAEVFDPNALACSPPMGPGVVVGKNRVYSLARTAPLNFGPICTTSFQDFKDFKTLLPEIRNAMIEGSIMAAEYEKIRLHVATSMNNFTAVSGIANANSARSQFSFSHKPSSYGSLNWALQIVDRIGPYWPSDEEMVFEMSKRTFKKWILDYAKSCDIEISIDKREIRGNISGFSAQFDSSDFVITSDGTNRTVRFKHTRTPIYVNVYDTGNDTAEWDFVPFFTYEPGTDTAEGQVNGIFQRPSEEYHMPCVDCNEEQGVTKGELILLKSKSAYKYESFPTNPLATSIQGVDTNLQNLYAGTNIRLHTGDTIDIHYLQKQNQADGGCRSNRLNTMFAYEVQNGFQLRQDNPEAAAALLVKIPVDDSRLPTCETCPTDDVVDGAALSAKEHSKSGDCEKVPEPEPGTPDCIRIPCNAKYNRPGDDDSVTKCIQIQRIGDGFDELSADYTVVDETTDGSEYELEAGTISILEGESTAEIQIVINGKCAEDPDFPESKLFKVVFTGDDICEGGCTETSICVTEAKCSTPCGGCGDSECDDGCDDPVEQPGI